MAKTKGPPPVDPTQGGRVLDLRAKLDKMREAKAAKEAAALEQEHADSKPVDVHGDAFQPRTTGVTFEQPSEVDRGGNVKARLQALGVKGSGLIKSHKSDQTRTTDTPLGKVLEGSIHADTAQGLQRLDGVVKAHEIGLQESRIKSADLLILKSLVEVGRFTIEGSPTLQSTDALGSLELGGSIYVGFNEALSRVMLNLRRADVLIIEGNPNLREIILPRFELATRYVVIEDNPNLVRVQIGTREKPAQIAKLEIKGNARDSYPDIFLA